jgi:hypothetical protein
MSLGRTLSHLRDSLWACNTTEQVGSGSIVCNLYSGDAQYVAWPGCWIL